MRIALYARVSTDDQYTDGQLDALRSYCERRGADALEYIDQGVSGAKQRRPALDQLMAAVRAREVDAVAVVKLDRLARSVRHLTHIYRRPVASRGLVDPDRRGPVRLPVLCLPSALTARTGHERA